MLLRSFLAQNETPRNEFYDVTRSRHDLVETIQTIKLLSPWAPLLSDSVSDHRAKSRRSLGFSATDAAFFVLPTSNPDRCQNILLQ